MFLKFRCNTWAGPGRFSAAAAVVVVVVVDPEVAAAAEIEVGPAELAGLAGLAELAAELVAEDTAVEVVCQGAEPGKVRLTCMIDQSWSQSTGQGSCLGRQSLALQGKVKTLGQPG